MEKQQKNKVILNNKVMVGMSGGVDSSATALLLKNQGFDVVGATLRLYDGEAEGDFKSCSSLKDVEDARSVCDRLGIKHYVFDFKDKFKSAVINKFAEEYYLGRTPNPCIDCNRYIKFCEMINKAKSLSIDRIATGHYARITKVGEKYFLQKPKDVSKDQTYVLYSLTSEQLSRTLMPLGEMTKKEVREFAASYGFVNAAKPDSQDICFVPDGNYVDFLARIRGEYPSGNFIDTDGKVIGTHQGMVKYTIGQRKGLGMGFGKPIYVITKNQKTNEVVLGDEINLFSKKVLVGDVNFSAFDRLETSIKCMGKLRYRQAEQPCTVTPVDEHTVIAEFDEPQRAVTAGQAAVFYDGDTLLGGGTIL